MSKNNMKQRKKHPVLASVLILIVLAVAAILIASIGSGKYQNVSSDQTEPTEAEISISGDGYSAVYKGCSSAPGIGGAFYLTLDIKNETDVEHSYTLENVYVDGYHCQSGSGIPITALGGKNVLGSFIIFSDADLESVEEIEFQISAFSENMNKISESDKITIVP